MKIIKTLPLFLIAICLVVSFFSIATHSLDQKIISTYSTENNKLIFIKVNTEDTSELLDIADYLTRKEWKKTNVNVIFYLKKAPKERELKTSQSIEIVLKENPPKYWYQIDTLGRYVLWDLSEKEID